MAVTTKETRFVLSAKDKTKVVMRGVQKNFSSLGKAVTGVHTQLLALAGIGGFGAVISGVISTNAEIQTLKSSLKTVTGSTENAAKAFDQISEFAKTTPYDLQQVTDSFIKLKALGLDPSEAAMRSYGNTASAMGKSLNQMIEAVADAATGEFERLKEFGIKAKKQGDEVSFTFQGVTTKIKNNSEEITKYLQGIGNNQFGGAMKDQMNNMSTAFSNFKGQIQLLQVAIGEGGLNDAVSGITNDLTDFMAQLKSEDVKQFTQSVMGSFADLLEGAVGVYDYINKNEFLQYSGIVGYLLFGKKGIGLALLLDQATNFLGKMRADGVMDGLGPSGITAGGKNQLPGYQLGDFNRAAQAGIGFDRVKELRDKYGAAQVEKQDETNELLRGIIEKLRGNNVAVAG